MRLHLAALLVLTACGGTLAACSGAMADTAARPTAARATAPSSQPQRSNAPGATATADSSSAVEAAASDRAAVAAPARATPDTPICRGYKRIVTAAADRFASLGTTSLPGSSSCTVIDAGSGHASAATYTCEFGTAPSAETLTPKRDELSRALQECGSTRAARNTRVRLVASGGAVHLVVNVHDTARW